MKRVPPIFSPSPAQAQTLLRWALGLFVLPLALFVAVAMLQAPPPPQVLALRSAELWQEPLGRQVFDAARLKALVQTAPDFSQATWQPVSLPAHIELGASVDLPPDAPKLRAWFRVQVPSALSGSANASGRLGLMGNRVMGGPWAVWANGQLVQANLADWRMQWNTPMRVMLPPGATELLIAVPYAQAQGYAMGTLFVGPADAIDLAWQARNFWQADAPRAASVIALVMMLVSLQLALGRRREPVFALLTANALVWALVNLQYFYDFTGQDRLSAWFGAAMDVSINWSIALNALFVFEFERIRVPRLRVGLVLYACVMTLLTLPLWHWEKNALLAQSYVNAVVYVLAIAVLAWHVVRRPNREGVVLCLALVVQLALGLHSVFYLTNQTQPDHVYTHPFAVVVMFLAFMYAINRRTVLALDTSERHQAELEAQLAEQQQRLVEQHAKVQQLEIQNRLAAQRDSLMQDLHDGLGSNLTSALLQARGRTLSKDETLLLLQDLTDELRNLNQPTAPDQCNLNTLLAELRQRVQHRLVHGGIQLVWAVDPGLPAIQREGAAVGQHLRALLNEAIANVIKHAQATQVCVSAQVLGEQVRIEITDNGCGFSPGLSEPGRGLPGMRERARLLGARLYIDAGEGPGCRWRLELPWAAVTRG
jgi:signal transduction histidine kinase